jgi:hypothetical protein
MQRDFRSWAGLWPFALVILYLLLGLWGHWINTERNKAALESAPDSRRAVSRRD